MADDVTPKQRLLSAAMSLIAEHGFSGVSVRQICNEAGTSINMLHHYFGSKQGVLEAIVAEFDDAVFSGAIRLVEHEPRSRDDFVSRIEMLFEATLDAYVEHRSLMMVVLREQANPATLPSFLSKIAEFFDKGAELGFVRAEVDSAMITGFLHDRIINQVHLAPWIAANYGTDPLTDVEYRRRWSRANVDVLLHGIVAP